MRYAALTLLACLIPSLTIAQPIDSKDIRVADGDTISAYGKTYRLVGFDTPETGERARCAKERALGERATARLQALIQAGELDLKEVRCACPEGSEGTRWCNWGRLCGTLTAKGEDVGSILMREGLARPFHCGASRCPKREGWC